MYKHLGVIHVARDMKMEDSLWKDPMKRINLLIFREITLIPTPTIPDGKIIQISDGAITRIQVQIKGFNKVNKLLSKGNLHN